MDFGLISGAHIVGNHLLQPTVFHFGNTPQAYVPTFESTAIGKRDPVVRRLRELSVPFAYDQTMYVIEGASDIWDVQARFGYKTGVAVALHLPREQQFMIGIDREQPLPKDGEKLTRMMAALQLLAVYAMAASSRHRAPAESLPLPNRRPTNRELEVLRWTLAGKTAWEVGMILNISERTAAIHANRATHKLECVSKHQAALKAMRLGLL